ncbi:UNVERIFIED_ORG: hypothetical protein J2X74_003184 [Bacillus sp. 1751]|nr:hypothetical protein [Bacillus sp. 1751]
MVNIFAVANTDINWYKFFSNNNIPSEINFWTPTPWNVRKLSEGDKFLFLLKAPYKKICGFGIYKYYENLSITEVWDKFGTANGVESFSALASLPNKYAKKRSTKNIVNDDLNRQIGCIVLSNAKFFSPKEFIDPSDLGISFANQVVKFKYFDFKLPNDLFDNSTYLPEEIPDNEPLLEGAKKRILVNAYERNPLARKKCLDYHGYNCSICGFNFTKMYGDIGKDFIHVHHLLELHQLGKEYKVDPIADLRPVCPNCHAMLHKKKPAYSIEELKGVINYDH